jgi:shikimate kinase
MEMHEAEPAAQSPRHGNIFLVGMMGAGKTSVGRLLARQLNKTFFDSDHEIERRTGVKIPIIFDIEGESGFRLREAAMIDELSSRTGIVLATGGGAVLREDNRRALAANGTVIYLRASAEDLWLRTRHDKNRPLLRAGDARERIVQMHQDRDPLYRSLAHLVVDTGSQSVRSLVQRLQQELARADLAVQASD